MTGGGTRGARAYFADVFIADAQQVSVRQRNSTVIGSVLRNRPPFWQIGNLPPRRWYVANKLEKSIIKFTIPVTVSASPRRTKQENCKVFLCEPGNGPVA